MYVCMYIYIYINYYEEFTRLVRDKASSKYLKLP